MSTSNQSEWIKLLIDNAEQLRAAGVQHVTAGDCSAEIAPMPSALPEKGDEDDEDGDPLKDPATFGGLLPVIRRRV